jgi:hypothetical protein
MQQNSDFMRLFAKGIKIPYQINFINFNQKKEQS